MAPFATLLQTLVHRPDPCNPFFSLPANACSVQFGSQDRLKLPCLHVFCPTIHGPKDAKMWPVRELALHPKYTLPTNMGQNSGGGFFGSGCMFCRLFVFLCFLHLFGVPKVVSRNVLLCVLLPLAMYKLPISRGVHIANSGIILKNISRI